jgi:hypothetical protein
MILRWKKIGQKFCPTHFYTSSFLWKVTQKFGANLGYFVTCQICISQNWIYFKY